MQQRGISGSVIPKPNQTMKEVKKMVLAEHPEGGGLTMAVLCGDREVGLGERRSRKEG